MPLIDLPGLGHFKDRENAMIAENFAATKDYAAGDYCYFNGTLKKFKTAHAAGAWIGTDAEDAKLAGDVSSLKGSIGDIDNILDVPMSMSRTAETVYQYATAVEGIPLKKDQRYLLTFRALSTPTGTVYCYLRDSSDATLANTRISADLIESSFVYKPTQNYSNCMLKIRITGAASAGITVECSIKEDKGNAIEELEKDVAAQGSITGYTKPNLFDNTMQNAVADGITITVNADKSVTMVGTPTSNATPNSKCTLPRGKYIVNGCLEGSSQTFHIMIVRADNSLIYQFGGRDVSFEVTDEAETITLYCRVLANKTVDTTMYPMIRPASVYNPTYAPYGEYQVYKSIQQLIDYTQFNWSGKKMNVIGDSIVAGSYGNFIIPIRDILCLSEARNYGVGGSCLASSSADADYPPAVLRYTSMDLDAQIIIVHAGTNDYSAQIPLGDSDSTDITTFNGALNVMMAGLRDMYPTALIIFDSILHRFNDNELTIKASQYRQCIEDRCLANHMVFYDAYKYSGFDFAKGYYDHILTNDGLHPNQTGANILGRKLAGFIKWN